MENQLKVSLENIIPLTEARDHFSQIVSEVQKDKLYVLTKGGKPAVAIIDVKYLEAITGGEIQEEHIVNEIKKDPQKVGLPPMVSHSQAPVPTQTSSPVPLKQTPPLTPPIPPTSQPKPIPKPAGFAAPQPKPENIQPKPEVPQPKVESDQPKPVTVYSPDSDSQKQVTPPDLPTQKPVENFQTDKHTNDDQIDVQIIADADGQSKTPIQNSTTSSASNLAQDDKSSPAQYAGDSEPADMALD